MSGFTITGNVCEMGDLEDDTPGIRLRLADERIVTLIGLTREEVIKISGSFLRDVQISVSSEGEAA